ncbi:uncharacterized protein LOC136063250 [Quercus suber]|uniref:uncharacterized protein LOC136063250 n=1 Tax=Quercus suber TaxID=58331 RepID=UPI0032DFD5BA
MLNNYKVWKFHGESAAATTAIECGSSQVQESENLFGNFRGMLQDLCPPHEMPPEPMEEGPSTQHPAEGPNDEAKKFYKPIDDVDKPLYEDAKLPKDHYEAKKIVRDLGLGYEKIHACPNDCMLFLKENANLDACPCCKESRWKTNEASVASKNASSSKGKKKAAKILQWFPLKPRLQRLFPLLDLATSMKWHVNGRTDDGVMRHPADSDAWKTFDSKHLEFSSDPRNVRLGLAVDGFNPFGIMSSTHNLSGWSTKGGLACPSCAVETDSRYLKNGRKFCYMGHRQWLDVDHDFRKEEKNVMDNILGTVLNLKDQTKNNYKARLDLADMGIRSELLLQRKSADKYTIPPTCFHMTSSEKDGFLQVLKDVTVPDGYASNISRRVNMKERKISDLKSHDNHILMQQLFPIASRGSLPSHVTRPFIKLACFFREICSKTLKVSDIATVEADIAVTLYELEKIFSPSFFTAMVHLVMYLAAEAKIGGPVHYRWMYPIKRYLLRLKSYVQNRTAPEGSIAEGYIVEECLTFCSRYMEGVETIFNRPTRTIEESTGVISLTTANREREGVSDTLVALSKWPYIYVKRFKHYVINGLKFRSVNDESNRKTQNSGVSVATDGGITFYGVLSDIIEVNYSDNIKHVLFKCKWVDDQNRRGYRTDEFGFPMVNFTHFIHGRDKISDEPYVLASQATQVFYVEDKRQKNWYVVVKTKARDVFNAGIGPQCDEDDTYSFSENVPYNISTNEVVSENLGWIRDDVEGMTIDASIIAGRDLHEVHNLGDYEFIDDEFDNEDDNEDEYTDDK